jgi:Putative Na+/H+ antiporter
MSSLSPTTLQIIAAVLFAVAIIHTFSTKYFEHLAHTRPAHSGLWHLLGEVEIVFGFWALVLAVTMVLIDGTDSMKEYVNSRNFTEPLFVFVIMVVAATRPILQTSKQLVEVLAKLIPGKGGISTYFIVLTVVPLLGSFITEPAAMTLAALMLADKFFSKDISSKLKYATIGVLFVNISIGGTLTAYAAPPVLMVAGTWNWDTAFMLTHFGWKAAIAVFINGIAVTLLFAKELAQVSTAKSPSSESPTVPMPLVLIHIAILAGIVLFAHYPPLFIGLFLLFMGIATASGSLDPA